MSTLSLTGLGWADGSKATYDTAKAVVGTERRKARYWVYDNVGEVDQIIAVRKAVGYTKEACDKARRDFAALKDAWWNDRASRLQRAAENGDTKVVHQLLWEVCGPTQRKAIITLSIPRGGTSKVARHYLAWAARIINCNESRLPWVMMDGQMACGRRRGQMACGRRRRGHPNQRWSDTLKAALAFADLPTYQEWSLSIAAIR